VGQHELQLRFTHGAGVRALSFGRSELAPPQWRSACKAKLAELLGIGTVTSGPVRELRRTTVGAVTVSALVMHVDENLWIPAYLLAPADATGHVRAVMAMHGHGEVGPVVGVGMTTTTHSLWNWHGMVISCCARNFGGSAASGTWRRGSRGCASTTGIEGSPWPIP